MPSLFLSLSSSPPKDLLRRRVLCEADNPGFFVPSLKFKAPEDLFAEADTDRRKKHAPTYFSHRIGISRWTWAMKLRSCTTKNGTLATTMCWFLVCILAAAGTSFGFQQPHPQHPARARFLPTSCTSARAARGVPFSFPVLAASQLEETTGALPPPRTWVQRPGWPPKPSSMKDDEGDEHHRGLINGSSSSSEPPARPKRRRRQKTKPMPVTGYDSRAIEEFYDMRPFQVGWRLNSLGFPLLGWYLRLLLDKMLGIDGDVEVQRRRGAELREHLVASSSVALIKSGASIVVEARSDSKSLLG